MDRGRPTRRSLIVAAVALLLGAAGADSEIPIREARWLAPGRTYEALTHEPAECLALPAEEAERRSIAIGRAAFRSPLLLGGQAARVGMSCASCHRNGRGNPDFLFPGLSGAPGTADVTSSLMSSRRGDNVANPKPIPDLGGPRAALKVSGDALQPFIHGLVVEEFDGAEPPAEIMAGLAAYVRALRPEACRGRDRPIRLAQRLDAVQQAVDLARGAKGETRRLLLSAARSGLGEIDERFQLPELEPQRALLREADRTLQTIRSTGGSLAIWDRRWRSTRRALLRAEHLSLYSARLLRQMVNPP